MKIDEIATPALLDRDVRVWRGFSGKTQAEAVAEFARLYPHYSPPVAAWHEASKTLFVPWDWRRE